MVKRNTFLRQWHPSMCTPFRRLSVVTLLVPALFGVLHAPEIMVGNVFSRSVLRSFERSLGLAYRDHPILIIRAHRGDARSGQSRIGILQFLRMSISILSSESCEMDAGKSRSDNENVSWTDGYYKTCWRIKNWLSKSSFSTNIRSWCRC